MLVLAVVGAAIATMWSFSTSSVLLYGDARAHLDVARHVTDGLSTGLSQLGSVWLPVPHMLLVPFTVFRPLWHSGLAGSIVGGLCYVAASVGIFKIVQELTDDTIAPWVGFGVFALNLNLMYVQSTALTEPVLLAFFIGATLFLVRWMRTLAVRSLMVAALLTALATLTRYEGWMLLAVGGVVVIVWSRMQERRRKAPEANLVLFAVVGGYGVVLWFIYNATIFGDPLYFAHSTYSAQVINGAFAKYGLLGTKGNLTESLLTYGWDIIGIVGPLVAIAGAVAAVALAVRHRDPTHRRTLMTLALLASPMVLEVVSLYLGQTTIRVPQRPPHEIWNVRYGLMALPFCAVAVGTLLGRSRRVGASVVLVAAVGTAALAMGTPLALRDGRSGTSSATAGRPERAAAYLHASYRGGRVLADDSRVAAFVFAADLDLQEFVTPGFHPYWEHALRDPGSQVRWVVSVPGDAIATGMAAHRGRYRNFELALTDGDLKLYRRRST